MISRSRIRNAFSTHYVGDVRALNNELLDTYQLKSLDGFLDIDLNNAKLVKIGSKYYLSERNANTDDIATETSKNSTYIQINSRIGYDKVLSCLGFRFDYSLFQK